MLGRGASVRAAAVLAAAIMPAATSSAQCGQWSVPGTGLTGGWVLAGVEWDADGDGPAPRLLVVAGTFTATGDGTSARGLAAFDGETWSEFAGPVHSGASALLALEDGSLLIGGGFARVGTLDAYGVARWDGTTWHAYPRLWFANVRVLLDMQDGKFLAAGRFRLTQNGPDIGVARWTGTAWEAFGEGIVVGAGGEVQALVRLSDGSIIAGGRFQSIGGVPARNVARWDGAGWSELGDGLSTAGTESGSVSVLTVDAAGHLFAGGDFTRSGETTLRNLARWDGSAWRDVGGGVRGRVEVLRVLPDGVLLVAGFMNSVGSGGPDSTVYVANAATWDGVRWHRAGASVRDTVFMTAALADGGTALGGQIVSAAGQPASGVAIWRQGPNDPDINQDGNVDQDDIAALLTLIGQSTTLPALVEADFDCNGHADVRDLEALALVIAGGLMP